MADTAPTVLLRSEDGDDQLVVVDLGGSGRPPLHRHDVDGTFYILEGELTFQLGDNLVVCRAGELTDRAASFPPHLRQPEPIAAEQQPGDGNLLKRRRRGSESSRDADAHLPRRDSHLPTGVNLTRGSPRVGE